MFCVCRNIAIALIFAVLAGDALAWRDIYPSHLYATNHGSRYSESNVTLYASFSYTTNWIPAVTNFVIETNWVAIYPYPTGAATNPIVTTLSLNEALAVDAWLAVEERSKWLSASTNVVQMPLFRIGDGDDAPPFNSASPLQLVKNWIKANYSSFIDPYYAQSQAMMESWWSNQSNYAWAWMKESVEGYADCTEDSYINTTRYVWVKAPQPSLPFFTLETLCQRAGLPYTMAVQTQFENIAYGWEVGLTNVYAVTNQYVVRTNAIFTYLDVTPWRGLAGDGPYETNMLYEFMDYGGDPPGPFYNTNNAIAPGFEANDYTWKHMRNLFTNLIYIAKTVQKTSTTALYYYGNAVIANGSVTSATCFVWGYGCDSNGEPTYPTPCSCFCFDSTYLCSYEAASAKCDMWNAAQAATHPSMSEAKTEALSMFIEWETNSGQNRFSSIAGYKQDIGFYVSSPFVVYAWREAQATAQTYMPSYTATVWSVGWAVTGLVLYVGITLKESIPGNQVIEDFKSCASFVLIDESAGREKCTNTCLLGAARFKRSTGASTYPAGGLLKTINAQYAQGDAVPVGPLWDSPRIDWPPDRYAGSGATESGVVVSKSENQFWMVVKLIGDYL